MKRESTGTIEKSTTTGETVRAFVPNPLPPEPPLELSQDLAQRLDNALVSLGRLDRCAHVLPDQAFFIYSYVRKEAVLSSMIEGTQSSLSDLLVHELDEEPGVPFDDVDEVSHYVRALKHGLTQMDAGLPPSSRLICDVHRELLASGRGSSLHPGEFRTSQNWIGGARPGAATFVPPPPHHVPQCMSDLEKFLHEGQVRTLIRIALMHVQFETIHPFLDGNGRVGRLLITLALRYFGILHEPVLYLSLYFKRHRSVYYDLLTRVRTEGDWEAWLEFFADAVVETSAHAVQSAERILAMDANDRVKVSALGRTGRTAELVRSALSRAPIGTAKSLSKATGLTQATVNKMLVRLEELSIVREVTGRQRDRFYAYAEYLDILNEGAASPPDSHE